MSDGAVWALALAVALAAVVAVLILWSKLRPLGRPDDPERLEALEKARELARVQAIAEERERIYADLHDDIGAKLLTLIHTADDPEQADLARSVLQDLRDVVSRSRGTPGTLHQVLADIRSETRQRLDAAGVGFVWEQDEDLPDPQLDQGHSLHLSRIVREAVTNSLKHNSPGRLRVRARTSIGELILDVTDDGPGDIPDPTRGHGGMASMQDRAGQLHGTIDWVPGTLGGTKVLLRMPLPGRGDGP